MPIKTMEDLYVNELKDLYSAEKQILKALPRMAKAASHAGFSHADVPAVSPIAAMPASFNNLRRL